MKALVYMKPGRANGVVTDVPTPTAKKGEVRIKVMACAICKPAESSHDRETGSLLGSYPATPGHEFSGVVESVGEGVTNVKPGDRVVADNAYPCGTCYYCQKGQPEMCENYRCQGHNLQGGFAEYIICRAEKVYKFSEKLSFDKACVSELINCSLSAVENAHIGYGENVAVIGAGSSGNLITQLVRHSDAGRVVALDPVQVKLDRVAKCGAETILVDPKDFSQHEKRLKKMFPHGLDVIIDAAGDDGLMLENAMKLLAPYGRLVVYSFFYFEPKTFHVDPGLMISKGLTICSAPLRTHSFGQCINVLEDGKVDPSLVITDCFHLDDYFKALDLALKNPETGKVIIHPNPNDYDGD